MRPVRGDNVPVCWDVRTRLPSSLADRADRSSSWGSMPNARTIRLALPLLAAMSGRATVLNTRCGPATVRATAIGREIAQFLGMSSPTTICSTVATNRATAIDTTREAPSGSPDASVSGSSRREMLGSAMKPTTSVVTVIPS